MKPITLFAVSCASLMHAGVIQSGTVKQFELFVPDDLGWNMNFTTSTARAVAGGFDMPGPSLDPMTTLNFVVPSYLSGGNYTIVTNSGNLSGYASFYSTAFVFTMDPFTPPPAPLPGQTVSVVTPFTMSGVLDIRTIDPIGPIFYTENVTGAGYATYSVVAGQYSVLNRSYTFTFTPEPTSFSMIALGGLLTCAAAAFRHKRRSSATGPVTGRPLQM